MGFGLAGIACTRNTQNGKEIYFLVGIERPNSSATSKARYLPFIKFLSSSASYSSVIPSEGISSTFFPFFMAADI
jgi:hypothetical protein